MQGATCYAVQCIVTSSCTKDVDIDAARTSIGVILINIETREPFTFTTPGALSVDIVSRGSEKSYVLYSDVRQPLEQPPMCVSRWHRRGLHLRALHALISAPQNQSIHLCTSTVLRCTKVILLGRQQRNI